ncbi:MAG: hypothetical protein K2N51_14585 [Lachnospiraceae bacterium]|nr:hypothetical protein [Lachnospiraceae bacterium]
MKKILYTFLIVGIAFLASCSGGKRSDKDSFATDSLIQDSTVSISDSVKEAEKDSLTENEISSEDLDLLNKTLKAIYKGCDENSSGIFGNWTMEKIKKFGSETLIKATKKNYDYANKRRTNDQEFVDPNPLFGDIFEEGTDGSIDVRYKGVSLGEVNKNGDVVDANVKLKVDVYELEDWEHENWKLYKKEEKRFKLRFVFNEVDGERVCKLDDIMFEDKPSYEDIPVHKWLKQEMENNRLLKPAFRP